MGDPAAEGPSVEPLTRRWLFGAGFVALVLCLLQSPGLIVADTKYDLTQNPIGFLARAAHQWSSQAPLGQVQNQAYGYFFPHGPFFALGQLLHIPPWITQRFWWALLIVAGFWGIIRVAEALGIGSRSSRIIAAVAFALSPRVLTTIGSISSESLPMMLAPWVLLPVVVVATSSPVRVSGVPALTKSARALAARSALAVALMGAVNAVATLAACLVAGLWWLAHRPNRRWWVFTAWWIPSLLLATLWWIIPLLLLGRVSPPFLDYIESAGVTTQWTSLTEVLRGTGSWTPFVSPERVAGTVLVTQPIAVVATGLIAAAGLAGLCMRAMPAKGRLTLILLVGIAGLGAGYVGELGSPIADQVRTFLDSTGAPLRNVHKLEPLVRLPLVLGLAHLLARVPLPGSVPLRRWRSAFAHPEREPMVALTSLLLVALTLTTSLAWTGRLAPRGAYAEVPSYWHDAAQWLADNAAGSGVGGADAERALVVPGAPFGAQVWGLTRDEPLQALASTPWAVRDAVPLVPPGAIRALDSVQRLISDGRPSDGLATALLGQGVRYLVVRNDLDPETSRSARPLLVHQTIEGSPGLEKVAQFGEDIVPAAAEDVVVDSDLQPAYPAIEIYRVTLPTGTTPPAGPYTVDLDRVPVVQGGPESLLRLAENGTVTGPTLLATDARRAGIDVDAVTVTDTPTARESDFGQVDNHSSALRSPGDPRRTYNLVPDYPVADAPLVQGEWSGATITVSSSAADATQLGGTAPGSGPAATIDGDPATAWLSNGLESALGQWLQLDFDTPITRGMLHLTVSPAAFGPPVKWLEIETPNGTASVKVDKPGKQLDVSLPSGTTPWVRITATHTEDGSVGIQFGISDLSVDDYSAGAPTPVSIVHRTVLPPTPPGARVQGWDLGQELPGRSGCATGPDRVHCSNSLFLPPEEPGVFSRTLSVPDNTSVTPGLTVRPRPGPALETLVSEPNSVSASGAADGVEVRGSAYAATDGDPATSWTAPAETARGKGGLPTLTIALPRPTLVTGLQLTPSLGDLPAAPSRIAVNLGNGPQTRDLDDTDPSAPQTIPLEPHVTDRIVLTLVKWHEVLDRTALGFLQLQPAGLSEVVALGADGRPVPGTATPAPRTVTVGCDAGPTISIAGRVVRTSITATTQQLASGTPVTAMPCPPADAVPLTQGRQDVVVAPGEAFTVDSLQLTASPTTPPAVAPSPDATEWTANLRKLTVTESDTERLLVVPESTNSGWVATGADGSELAPVVVNGWQQGWILPAGTDGTVTLEFPSDRWYRAGIVLGLVLLIPLILLALVPRRRTPDLEQWAPPRPWKSVVAGFVGVMAVVTIVAGPVGTGVALLVAAGSAGLARWRGPAFSARVLVGVAGTSAALAAVLLSTGPWRAADGYVGHSFLVQLPALIALAAVGVAALPLAGSPMWRRFSQRRTARRDGSSTRA
ncbi:alpha-(1-_3)-arabinofuranosyltransferase family protein [Rhodococcus sp. ABRD24]|uniref:alpha-(1->3)-arabinofuranosyltransferase domain-containing protein n=1 Tax=Rhodococcus sp. ABRD24 TaxID=2507582 RepID=UPI00325BD733